MLERFVEERVPAHVRTELGAAKKSMDRKRLTTILATCDKEGYQIKITRECRMLLDQIEDADAALEMASREMNEEYLNKALAMCDEFEYNGPTVQTARRLLKDVKKAKAGIEKAMVPPFVAAWLSESVSFCERINYIGSSTRYGAISALNQKIQVAMKLLEAAKVKLDERQFLESITYCNSKEFNGHSFTSPLLDECIQLYNEVKRLNKEADIATRECDEQHVRKVVEEAAAMGFSTKPIEALNKLVEGDYTKFLDRQFQCAKKCNHHSRAIRVQIKFKDAIILKNGQALQLSRFPGLKNAMDWAGEKFFLGSTAKRAELMLEWEDRSLQAPFTVAASRGYPEAVKKATDSIISGFDIIQQFMGQRSCKDLPSRVLELCRGAISQATARDDIYIGIMKQCNKNTGSRTPVSDPIVRAFQLLAFCLCVFPPSAEFEDFLEYWVRLPEYRSFETEYRLKGLIRRRVYFGAITYQELPIERDLEVSCIYRNGAMWMSYYDGGALESTLATRLQLKDFEDTYKISDPKSLVKSKSGEEKKKKPKKVAPPLPGSAKEPQVPSPWQAHKDTASGQLYYFNPV